MNGWLKLWRTWLDHELARDPKGWLVMTHLLCHAAIEPRENRRFGYTLKPGQSDETQEQLAAGTGLTRQEVREALRRLNQYGTITCNQAGNQRRTLITLVNWARYNGDGASTTNGTTEKQPTEQPRNNQSIRSKEVGEEKQPRASRAGSSGEVVIPHTLKGSEKAIREWLEYKREKGQGYKPAGLRAFFAKLQKLPNVQEAIEHSMANNWAGVFAPSGNGHSKIPMKVSAQYVGDDSRY